ncbi:hypothetical protein Taro_013809, partial [Colocasia esculenta]|nr:hypothetical protein [Colocasia esculenta]
ALIFANVCAIYVTILVVHASPIYSAAKLAGHDSATVRPRRKKRRTVQITEEGMRIYTCYASNINLSAIADQAETSNMEQHPTISNRRREQARAWLDRVNVEVDLPPQNEGGMGAADIATTSNHPLDQGRPAENPNIRPPEQAQQILQPQQLQQASQPTLPTTTPALGNLPPNIPCTEPLAEQPIENPNSSHGETQELHVTKQRHDAPQLNTSFEGTMVSQRAMIEQIIEAKMAEQNEGSATYDLVTERKVTLAELISLKQNKNESALDFIKRWRDMSMKCEQPPADEDAVKLCQRSLKPEIKEKLLGANIRTFEHLNSTVVEIEIFFAENLTASYGRGKSPKDENTGSREVNTVNFSTALEKAGGKGDTPASSNSKKEERRSAPTLSERLNTPYSFTREHTRELLDMSPRESHDTSKAQAPRRSSNGGQTQLLPISSHAGSHSKKLLSVQKSSRKINSSWNY